MSFITKADLGSHIYEENIDVITRGDEEKVNEAIEAAITEATGYLSRFDTDAIFSTEGAARNASLVIFIKDIAKWHLINICNASIDLQLAQDRYDRAIKYFDKIQSGKTILALPLKSEPEGADTYFHVKSNPKRGTHF